MINITNKYRCSLYDYNVGRCIDNKILYNVCRCPIFKIGKKYEKVLCKDGIIDIDWVTIITDKDILNEYFSKV